MIRILKREADPYAGCGEVTLGDVSGIDLNAFLQRLGLDEPGGPSASALRQLHRAFVERVPYEAIEIQLERPTTLDQLEAVDRIVRRRRGGYCFHLNGAFAVLLEALGYSVTLHRAGVQGDGQAEGIHRNHLALTVNGLEDTPGVVWLVDVGLGDALHEPLPLREGTYQQGPFSYRLRPSRVAQGGWRLDHDPRGSFLGMDFDPAPATMSDFRDKHQYLCTSPESGFVRVCTVQRRDVTGVDILRALTLSRLSAGPVVRTVLDSPERWYEALADVFALTLDDVPPDDRARLWRKAFAQHEAHAATRAIVDRPAQ
jgi:N-hydroxyarylamine O-acetyltransferase